MGAWKGRANLTCSPRPGAVNTPSHTEMEGPRKRSGACGIKRLTSFLVPFKVIYSRCCGNCLGRPRAERWRWSREQTEDQAAGVFIVQGGGGRGSIHSHVAVTELVKNISINKTNKQHIH